MPSDVLAATAKRVIVADDTAFVRDRFRTALEDAGHRPTTVASSAELVTHVTEHAARIDLVVLDLRLPQATGIELVRALRKIDGFRAPIVVFSGTIANAGEVRQLSGLGVAGYVNEYTAVQHIMPSLSPHLFPDSHNRRSSPRVVLGISVSYRLGNTIAAAVSLNISHGGVAVRTTSPPEPGTELKIRFKLPGGKKEIEGDARVAWTDRRVGMGLQFTRLDDADQAAVDEFVQTHFFSNRRS
jgi:uncharacterized protein (TIGR02266 family)